MFLRDTPIVITAKSMSRPEIQTGLARSELNAAQPRRNSGYRTSRKRLISLEVPPYTGLPWLEGTQNDPRRANEVVYSLEEKRKVIQEFALSFMEEVSVLPGATEDSPGHKVVRVYYRKCWFCAQVKPLGLFPETEEAESVKAFTCSSCF